MLLTKLKSTLCLAIIFCIIFSTIFSVNYKTTSAQSPILVTDTEVIKILSGLYPGEAQKEGGIFGIGWDGVAYFAARILIRQLTQSIVDWINTGFQGNPSFLKDPQKFLEKTADRAIGNFIQSSDLAFLCEPFQLNIKVALGLKYSPFKDQIGCRLSDILKNTEGAYNDFVNGDFIGGGGWESWLSITTIPQNNQIGAMMIAEAELDARVNNLNLLNKDQLNWSGGFLSMKQCTKTTKNLDGQVIGTETYKGDPYYNLYLSKPGKVTSQSSRAMYSGSLDSPLYQGSVEERCETVTPGKLISDQMGNASKLDMDALNAADEINEIVGALANFVITKVMEKGFAAISKEDIADDEAWRQGLESIKYQQYNYIAGNPNSFDTPNYTSNTYNPDYEFDNGYVDPDTLAGLEAEKKNARGYLLAFQTQEGLYYDNNTLIYNSALDLNNISEDVIACYDDIDQSLLSNSEKSQVEEDINSANSIISEMSNLRTGLEPGLLVSENNLGAIDNTLAGIEEAQSLEDIKSVMDNFIPTLSLLHSWTETDSVNASTTLKNLDPKLNQMNSSLSYCENLVEGL